MFPEVELKETLKFEGNASRETSHLPLDIY